MNNQKQTDFPEKPQLLIVGASTRAAAYSALRAGYQPVCVDQYADQDLQNIAKVIPKTDDCAEWLETISQHHSTEWIYTGAMENHSELIEQISQKHQLRGCDSKVLERVRNPFFLEQILSKNRILAAPCLPANSIISDTEKWLCKPLKGAAGSGIQFIDSNNSTNLMQENCYLQRYQPGIPLSALFIAFPQITVLIGISLQFNGNPACNVNPFQFCGGVTLPTVVPWLNESVKEMGQTISQSCPIQGFFGCDFILNPDDEDDIWLNEVNPRYTALTELFELHYRLPLLHWHLAACGSFENDQTHNSGPEELQNQLISSKKQPYPHISKGILYTSSNIKIPKTEWKQLYPEDYYQIPKIADVPHSDMTMATSSPICTVYGIGENLETCLQSLAERMVYYQKRFEPENVNPKIGLDASSMFESIMKIEKRFF